MRLYTFLFAGFMASFTLFSQETTTTLEEQFQHIYNSSSNYKEYKVVPKASLLQFKDNALDSIAVYQSGITRQNDENRLLIFELEKLKKESAVLTDELERSIKKQKSITILGIETSKTLYSLVMWGIIFVLLVIFSILLYKYKVAQTIAKSCILKLKETDDEFLHFKQRSMEREQQLNRKLLDEIKKQKKTK